MGGGLEDDVQDTGLSNYIESCIEMEERVSNGCKTEAERVVMV